MSLLVSVVVVTYRKFDNIRKAITSILNQDYPHIELIVSDDGSPNFPREQIESIIESLGHNNIESVQIIHHEKNVGTVKNINYAYYKAKGDILFPLAGDDCLYTNTVVSQVAAHFNDTSSNVLVTSRVICNNGKAIYTLPLKKNLKKIKKLSTPYLQHRAIIREQFYDMASGSVLYIRKSFFIKVGGFDESYRLWEDGPFITKFTNENTIDTRYDIQSIVYSTDGISNSGTNSLMRVDRLHYNETDRICGYEGLDIFTKRTVDYINKRYKAEDKIAVAILYVKYLDVIWSKILYRLGI